MRAQESYQHEAAIMPSIRADVRTVRSRTSVKFGSRLTHPSFDTSVVIEVAERPPIVRQAQYERTDGDHDAADHVLIAQPAGTLGGRAFGRFRSLRAPTSQHTRRTTVERD